MENANGLLWEVSIWEFVLVTVCLAGGAAYLTGRAIARTWQGPGILFAYMVLLAGATRFIHFALFGGTLLSPYYFAIDLVVIVLLAFVGKQVTRSGQMSRQYSFLFDRKGSLGWTRRR